MSNEGSDLETILRLKYFVQPLDAVSSNSTFKDFTPSEDQIKLLTVAQKIALEDLRKHVLSVQEEAYQEFPYPCILQLSFMEMRMATQPVYEDIVSAGCATEDALFLDVGCNMGTDVRKLVFDGYPVANVYGCDLHNGFIDLGYKLYGDKSTCKIDFFATDMFSLLSDTDKANGAVVDKKGSSINLEDFEGRVKHLYGGLLFHLFDEKTQMQVARVFARLIERKPGSVIFGTHIGGIPAGELSTSFSRKLWGQSPDTFCNMWKAALTELEGEKFVREHVRVQVDIRTKTRCFTDKETVSYLVWNVSFA